MRLRRTPVEQIRRSRDRTAWDANNATAKASGTDDEIVAAMWAQLAADTTAEVVTWSAWLADRGETTPVQPRRPRRWSR